MELFSLEEFHNALDSTTETQSVEHLDVPTNATLRLTNQQVNN